MLGFLQFHWLKMDLFGGGPGRRPGCRTTPPGQLWVHTLKVGGSFANVRLGQKRERVDRVARRGFSKQHIGRGGALPHMLWLTPVMTQEESMTPEASRILQLALIWMLAKTAAGGRKGPAVRVGCGLHL